MQLSKDAAFETISDPKYSGKMKVNPFLTRKINIVNSNRFGLYYMDIRKYTPNSFGGFNYSVYG